MKSDVLVIRDGVVIAKIYGMTDGAKMPDGQTILPASEYTESMNGSAVAWPRAKRNALLASSDWAVVADNGLASEKVDAAKTWRAALRAMPETQSAVAVEWPAAPDFLEAKTQTKIAFNVAPSADGIVVGEYF